MESKAGASEAGGRKKDHDSDTLWTQDREAPRSYDLVRTRWRQALHRQGKRQTPVVRNVQKTPQIKLSMGGESFSGTARFLADRTEHARAMAAIRRKYWMYRPIMAFGQILIGIGVSCDSTGSFEVILSG